MSLLRIVLAGMKTLFGRKRAEADMNDELGSYLDAAVTEKVRSGMSREDAIRAVRVEMGSVEAVKEEVRAVGWETRLELLGHDLRYAVRMLRRNPGFTAVAVLSLALGIGANTSIFTLINGVMLKSLPVRDPQRLVSFGVADGAGVIGGLAPGPFDLFAYDFYKRIEATQPVLSGVCAFGSFTNTVRVRRAGSTGLAEQVNVRLVSGTYFDVLGVEPALGRMIGLPDAATPGSSAVAVISYRYWQRKLASDHAVIGSSLMVSGTPFTVIGVAPAAFFGESVDADPPDLWMPLTMQPQVSLAPTLLGAHSLEWMHLMGRQKEGVSLKQAQEWVDLRLRQYLVEEQGAKITPDDQRTIARMYVDLIPVGRGLSHLRVMYAEPLEILMGAVVLVLLIACANLANLLLARASVREREISTRLALGAGRARIVRQMLTEALLLSCLGGAVGLLFASWGTRALMGFVIGGSQEAPLQSTPDAHVLLFTLALSLLTGLIFGLAPAMRISRVTLAPGLKAGSRTVSGDATHSGRFPVPKILVAAQVALSLLLLVGAGLFVRTLHNLNDQDFGFDRQSVLIVNTDARMAGYAPGQINGLDRRILDTLGGLPGVRSVTLSTHPPMSGTRWSDTFAVEGRPSQPNEDMGASLNAVGPNYFETVGIPIVLGRGITDHDGQSSPKVGVVNQTAADYFFPHQNPIGRHISYDDPAGTTRLEIVGVARNAKYNRPREKAQRMVYPALLQLTGEDLYADCIQIRAVGNPAQVSEEVRRAIAGIDSNLPIQDVVTVSRQVDAFLGHEEMISQLSGFFALLALVLACIGLYGVMSYNVMRRTNEIGIRMALGARAAGVLWMVLKECVALLAVGLVLGIPVTLAATKVVRSELFGLSPSDPLTIIVATLSIAVVSLAAGYLPAWRATKVDPIRALRYE